MRVLTVTGLAALTLAAGAAVPPATLATPDSGISGTVRGASCGPPLRIMCPKIPGRVTVEIRTRRTQRLVRTVHVRDRRFRVALAPGRYTLEAIAGGGAFQARTTARVRAHAYTPVVLRLQAHGTMTAEPSNRPARRSSSAS